MSVDNGQIHGQVAEAIKWPTAEEMHQSVNKEAIKWPTAEEMHQSVNNYFKLISDKEKKEQVAYEGLSWPSKKYIVDTHTLEDPQPPTITVQEAKKEADERVDNVYGYVIDNLRALALAYEVEAAKVNIFDTERLTRMAKVKVLREAAALIETYREKAAQTFPIKAYPRIDELDPNKLFPIESNTPDPFSEQNS